MEDVTDTRSGRLQADGGRILSTRNLSNSDGLVRGSRKTKQRCFSGEEERPIGIQIYGGDVPAMEGAAQLAERPFAPTSSTSNAGSWVRDVAMRGAGAGLLRDLPKMEKIASTVVKAVKIPVTLKTRLGWIRQASGSSTWAKMMRRMRAIAALTVHCRTRDQGHKGAVDYSWIRRSKRPSAMRPSSSTGTL